MKQIPAAMSVLLVLVLGIEGMTFLANSKNVRVHVPPSGASPQLVLPVK